MNKLANKKKKKVRKAPVKKGKEKPVVKKKKVNNPKGKGGFPKGLSGNPQGRPKDPPEIKAIRESVRQELLEAVGWVVEIKDIRKINKSELTLLQAGVLKSFQKYKQTGNFEWIKYPMDHTIGKPKETIDLDTGGQPIVYNINPAFMPKLNNGKTDNKS